MHNRARLITACFLVKDLHIDWRRGEQHFMRLLLDGDEANNNGNWQWISSVGVDPAPLTAASTTRCCSSSATIPTATYVRRWVPELATCRSSSSRRRGRWARSSRSSTTRSSASARWRPTPRARLVSSAAMASFTIEPRGPFTLASAARFIAGWPPGQGHVDDDEVRLQLPRRRLERAGARRPARRTASVVHGTVEADNEPRAIAQAARIVSLDHDGTGYAAVGERDPSSASCSSASGYLRPVLFHSPYEAAAWSVISARTRHAQAVKLRDALSRDGIFPAPRALLELRELEACRRSRSRACTGSPRPRSRAGSTASRCSPQDAERGATRGSRSSRASARSTPG